MKKGSLIPTQYKSIIQRFTKEQQGELFMAIMEYEDSLVEPKLAEPLDTAFLFIKLGLDENRAKYEETCRKRAEAGSKGGKQKVAKQANATFAKQSVAKQADSDCDSDNDINTPLTPLSGEPPELIAAVKDWLAYKKERREAYKPVGLKGFVTTTLNNTREFGHVEVIRIIRDSMASNYKGVMWDRLKSPRAGPKVFEQHRYSHDERERQKLASLRMLEKMEYERNAEG